MTEETEAKEPVTMETETDFDSGENTVTKETPQEPVTMETIRAQLAKMESICAGCKAPLYDEPSDEEAREYWLDYAMMLHLGPHVMGYNAGKRLICVSCEEREAARGTPREPDEVCFENSNPEVEQANFQIWGMAHNWTPEDKGFWLWGPEGVGKSYLARCVLDVCRQQGISVGELSAVEFNRAARLRFMGKGSTLAGYRNVRVLLIEDVDKAPWTPEGITELFEMLDNRYGKRQSRVFVTSNFDPREFTKQVRRACQNDSLARTILARMQPMETHEMSGPSWRT